MKKTIILALAAMLAALGASAQSFQEGFFLNGYRPGYRYNPALTNEGDFLSLGEWSKSGRNNFGASSFLYPTASGKVVTALHASVSPDTFLGSLNEDNWFNGQINFNLLAYGFRKDNSYHTLEANIRGLYSASIPIEIFEVVKRGTGNVNYDLSGLRGGGQAYVELAYGYARELSEFVSVGARAKLLLGVESASYTVNRFDLTLNENVYKADISADMKICSRMGKMRTDEYGNLNIRDIDSRSKLKLPAGAGLAFDLGVVVKPVDGLSISLSALDIGALLWYYGNAGKSSGTVEFTGVENLSFEDATSGDIAKYFDGVKEEFLNSVKLKPSEKNTCFEAVPMTFNAAVKYELPSYKALSLGVTGTYAFWPKMSYKECRAVAAWSPLNWLSVVGDLGVGDFGPVYGVALSARIRKFRLNAGFQNGFCGTVPYSSNPLGPNSKNLTVGLTFDL